MPRKKAVVVGFAGPAASGKTSLASAVLHKLKGECVVVVSADRYYKDHPHLTLEERAKLNYDHPDSLDTQMMAEQIVALAEGNAVKIPTYDYTQHARGESVEVTPRKVIIVEGILTLAIRAIRELIDLRVYIDTPLDICLSRRIRRDTAERGRDLESILNVYQANARPMFLKYIEPSKKYAHVVLSRGGVDMVDLEIITSRISNFLE